MTKWMRIVAGPNGAGKSRFTDQFLADSGPNDFIKLNADERTLELRKQFPDAAQDDLNRRAATAIDSDVERHITEDVNFVVETVLSTPKYRDDVLAAKANGFKVALFYISLYPPELSPQRVSERAAKGGHTVDPATAIARYHRSHTELRWFAPQADLFMAYDNPAVDRALADITPKPPNPKLGPS